MNNDLNYMDLDPEFDDELETGNDPTELEPTSTVEIPDDDEPSSDSHDEPKSSDEDDLITQFLKSKGIKDPKAIKQLDDDGNIQEVDFNSLSREEQLNILGSSDLDNNYGLDQDETKFISLLRDNNLSIDDYLNYIRNKAIEDFVASNSTPSYQIDNLSDDELYLLDLKYNFPDISEEEAAQYLEHEKSNSALWEKKAKILRDSYKAKEDEQAEEERLLEAEKTKEAQAQFYNSMSEAINNLKSIETFDLEDSDRERISEFVLGTDATGTNYMYRALQDPESVAKMAWFLMDGEDSIKSLNNYWTDVVKRTSQSKYEEGYQDAINNRKSKITLKSTPSKETKNKFISLGDFNPLDLD